jgi:glucose dehydrogenase
MSPIKVSIPIYGGMSSAPIVIGGKVYTQDMKSDAFALSAATGKQLWTRTFNSPDEGVNGLQVQYGDAFGVNVDDAFALQTATGEVLWHTKLTRSTKEGLEVAPGVFDNRVIVATTPSSPRGHYEPGADGVVWALNAKTGKKEWSWNTSIDGFKLWGNPKVNSGGGIWGTPAFDHSGNVYLDIANPAPFPGTKKYPFGSSRKGPDLYSDSIVKLNAATGKLEWYYQLTPHDLYDHDLQLAPILTTVNGRQVVVAGGKGGIVVEVDATTGKLIWKRPVGEHNGHDNDGLKTINGSIAGMPNPKKAYTVLPGELGGVETSMAVGGGMVYAPAANAGTTVSGNGVAAGLDLNHTSADFTAINLANGKVVWDHHFPVADFGSATYVNGLVFTTTYDGTVWALNAKTGAVVWHSQLPAGTNAGVSVAGNMLIAEADVATKASQHQDVVAYQLASGASSSSGSTGTTTGTSTTGTGTSTGTSSTAAAAGVSLTAGRSIFTANCATCHTLAAAHATGDVGPDLDKLKPSDALVTHQVTYGGGVMPAFGKSGKLSSTQIAAVAKFVSTEAGKVKAGSNGGNGTP